MIREDLTASRVDLLKRTISNFGLKIIWTESGKIYVQHNNKINILKNKNEINLIT